MVCSYVCYIYYIYYCTWGVLVTTHFIATKQAITYKPKLSGLIGPQRQQQALTEGPISWGHRRGAQACLFPRSTCVP